jgi:hypothetical protein
LTKYVYNKVNSTPGANEMELLKRGHWATQAVCTCVSGSLLLCRWQGRAVIRPEWDAWIVYGVSYNYDNTREDVADAVGCRLVSRLA